MSTDFLLKDPLVDDHSEPAHTVATLPFDSKSIEGDAVTAGKEMIWFAAYRTLPETPWRFSYYLSSRGAEWSHVYIWLAKDLSWTTGDFWTGIIFGGLAVLWSIGLIWEALHLQNWQELYVSISQLLWLFANYVWMWGELHDIRGGNETRYDQNQSIPDYVPIYDICQEISAYILAGALGICGLYTLVLKPCGWFPSISSSALLYYDERPNLVPRFPLHHLFPSWRSYENVHIFFWLGKDTCWCWGFPDVWWIFAAPTLLVGFDFVLTRLLFVCMFYMDV
jgi:hypothetical protein